MLISRQAIKAGARQVRRFYVSRFRAFGPGELAAAVRAVGIRPRDCVLAHSAYDAFEGFRGKPTDVVEVLQSAVGPQGILAMPTMPFTGTAVAYAATNPVFDVRRTPSRMGLVSEVFRRSPGVVRSVHPTHPVAAWGDDAASLVEGHHVAATPCGRGSPFARLLERRGKILLLGTGIDVLTFYHALEERFEDRFPVSPFTPTVFEMTCRTYAGDTVVTRTRLFDPAVSRRRNLGKLARELQGSGQWRERRAGGLSVVCLETEDVSGAVARMADKGVYCYD